MKKGLFYSSYFVIFFAQAISYCLIITFLISLGYSATERSLFFVVEAIFGMLLQSLLGYLCDKYKRIKIFWYLTLFIYVLFTYFLYITIEKNFWVHIFLVMGVGSCMRIVNGLLDSITIETSEYHKEHFGFIRSFGSIGWAVGSPVTAYLVEKTGYPKLGLWFALSIIILVLVALGIKDVNKGLNKTKVDLNEVRSLFSNKEYVITVMILLLFFIVDTTQSYAVVDKIWALNGTEKEVGYYWALAAMLELPLFFGTNKIAKKIGSFKLLGLAGILYTIRYILYGKVTTIFGVFIGGVLQAVTYPILIVLSKDLIYAQSPDHLKTSGQQVAMSIYMGGSALSAPLLVGLLEDSMGINFSLYTIAAIAVIPTIMTWAQTKK